MKFFIKDFFSKCDQIPTKVPLYINVCFYSGLFQLCRVLQITDMKQSSGCDMG